MQAVGTEVTGLLLFPQDYQTSQFLVTLITENLTRQIIQKVEHIYKRKR